jgi:energy-coupling factor transporter ATP-binding protein EcfA2
MSDISHAVLSWLQAQPHWQQRLARLLATKPSLDDQEIEELLVSIGSGDWAMAPLARDDVPGAASSTRRTLNAYGNLYHVGLVEPDQVLRFNSTLTVVYGDNAAGKSSYSRGLKLLSRSVTNDVIILDDVYGVRDAAGSGGSDPSAMIETTDADGTRAERVKLVSDNRAWLPELVAFDAACAEEMVNSRNELQYVPEPLRLLARLAAAQDTVRTRLSQQIADQKSARPATGDIPAGTSVGRALAALAGRESDPDLADLAGWDAAAQTRLTDVTNLLAAAASSTALTDAAAAEAQADQARDLYASVQRIENLCTVAHADMIRAAVIQAQSANDALTIATAAAGDLPGYLDSAPWKLLWQAARSFAAGHGRTFPPPAGETCPLCQQPLGPETAERLGHFDAHIRGELSRAAEDTGARLRQLLVDVDPDHVDDCRTPLLTTLRQADPQLAHELDEALDGLAAHLARLVAAPGDARAVDSTVADLVRDGLASLHAWAATRSQHAAALLVSRDEANLPALRAELAELDSRRVLAARLGEFTAWQRTLRAVAVLEKQRSELATNRITTAIRTLADAHTSEALRSQLEAETAALRCQQLPVSLDWRTTVGASTVQLVLDGTQQARISQIASDGERRALALAFFLAEASVSDPSVVVLDDPVSSLDLERREVIVDRLVAEAQQRQVIVFSHDLPFVVDLLSRAEAAGVPMKTQTVWRLGVGSVGRVQTDLPFRGMTLKQRVGVLTEHLSRWDSQEAPSTVDEAWRRVEGFYEDLRLAWERAIEERVFKGVLLRHERAVHSQKLKKVTVTDEIVEQVEQGMSRASFFVHDAPRTSGVQLPGRSELAADLEALRTFAQQVKPD